MRKICWLAILLGFLATQQALAAKGALYGVVLIIDTGHGGYDPGAHGYFPNGRGQVMVVEDEYVADVGRRLERIAKAHGALVIKTTRDRPQTNPLVLGAREVIEPDGNEVYTSTGAKVRAGNRGMVPRTDIANRALAKYPRHRVVFVSLHFDSTGASDLYGVHLIGPKSGDPPILQFLEEEFRKANRLRRRGSDEYHPVVRSGDSGRGVRDLFILRGSRNKVPNRVLIELGNFKNSNDVWRIRNHITREHYAQIIVRALMRYNQ